jgi:hypothetical protein
MNWILQSFPIDPHRQRQNKNKYENEWVPEGGEGDAVDHLSYETKHTSLTVGQLVEG